MIAKCKNCKYVVRYEIEDQYEVFEILKGSDCCGNPDYWTIEVGA